MSADKEWREVQIHRAEEDDTDDIHAHPDGDRCGSPITLTGFDHSISSKERQLDVTNDDEAYGAAHHMFDAPESKIPYEEVVYEFPSMTLLPHHHLPSESPAARETESSLTAFSKDTITIRHQGDYPFSTGLAVWGGSELMAKYLAQNPKLVQGKRVMELGAGAGLCGILVHRLGASATTVTDGDVDVLQNLRFNVQRNSHRSGDNHTNKETFPPGSNISCPQLIWGKNLEQLEATYGPQDLILASDCVYMIPSLDPLWQTVDRLLAKKCEEAPNNEQKSSQQGIFLWVNLCSSAVPLEAVLEMARRYGFVCEKPNFADGADHSLDEPTRKMISEKVYLFRKS
jgi:predicted nicotinamide N-methyase